MTSFSVIESPWPQEKEAIQQIRRRVFIEEQGVPEELEWDDLDQGAIHFIAKLNNGETVACCRLLTKGKLTRMAVLPSHRNHGIGKALLHKVVAKGRELKIPKLVLDAQTQAIDFYQRSGFIVEGPVFLDAGIEHKHMHLNLTDSN